MSTAEVVPAAAPKPLPLLPMDPERAREVMQRYQETTRAWLTEEDWIGEPGRADSFVKRSGWDKIATAYELSTEVRTLSIDRDSAGRAIRAQSVVRATAPSGRYRDGAGGCGINEPRFAQASGQQKLENDVPGTAETRASNRAIAKLVGFGEVSAEEVDADVRGGASAERMVVPAWAVYADDVGQRATADRLILILESIGADPQSLTRIGEAIRAECDGGVPQCVVGAVESLHAAMGSAPSTWNAPANGGNDA
jgi:hypothetical protein